MEKNYNEIIKMFKRLGFQGEDAETFENYARIKTSLENHSLSKIAISVRYLECVYGTKFPIYVQGMRRERYIEKIIESLILHSFAAKEDKSILSKTDNALEMAEKGIPGITNGLPWYLKLFRTNKN